MAMAWVMYGFKKLRGFRKPQTINVQNFTFQTTTILQVGGWGNNKEGEQPTGVGVLVLGEPPTEAKGAEAVGGGDSAVGRAPPPLEPTNNKEGELPTSAGALVPDEPPTQVKGVEATAGGDPSAGWAPPPDKAQAWGDCATNWAKGAKYAQPGD